jgi:hypothetical protein
MILYTNQDQKKDNPSGTHEYLQKHSVSGFWREVTEDESDSALESGGPEPFVKEVQAMRTASVEIEDSCTVKLDQYHGIEDEIGGKSTSEPQEDGEPDAALEFQQGPDQMRVEFGSLGHSTADSIGELNDTLDAPAESDDMTVHVPCNSNDVLDTTGLNPTVSAIDTRDVLDREGLNPTAPEFETTDVPDIIELNPTASEHDMMDLDIPGAKIRVDDSKSADAARALCTMNQFNGAQSSEVFGGWQVVNWRSKADQNSQQGWGLTLSAGIDPRELLEGWEWVFQSKRMLSVAQETAPRPSLPRKA